MSIQLQLATQSEKLALYQKAAKPPSPLTQTFSLVRISGQLAAELSALNTTVLHKLTPAAAANDPIY